MTDEQRAWTKAFLGRESKGAAAPVVPAGLPQAAPASGMRDEDIAAEIMDKQAAILQGWQTALQVFQTTMNSASDEEASPDFQKAIGGYIADKLMGAILKKAPGAEELSAVAGVLAGEAQRASAAAGQATLRDFVNQNTKAVGRLQQAVLSQRQGFISAVRAKREAVEAPTPGKKPPKGGWVEMSPALDEYGMMRMALMDTLDQVDAVLKVSGSEALFRVLSAEWVRNAKVRGGMGIKFQAMVIIRLNAEYGIIDAHIQGAGGQKIAEQLLKEFPDGVDVFNLKTPRRILLMAKNGWPSAELNLDANNGNINSGSMAEGDSDGLYKQVMSRGLPLTKVLKGD